MNRLILLSVVLAAISLARADLDKAKALKLLEECQKKLGSEEDLNAMVEEKIIPTSEKGKCLLACAAEENGFIDKDGKANFEKIIEYLQKKYADDEEKMEKAAKIVAHCSTAVDHTKLDKCEAANEYVKCAKEKKETL
uniref:Odorant-binding protein 3 n=1 Tax=Matsumurasca onukii TaxID=2912585 RepID=A0A343WGX2_MATON|nr:odorant-binding protein 3 [Matsumurasca onukii]